MSTARIPPISELRARVHKSETEYGKIPWISRTVIHPHLSIYISSVLLRIGLTGLQVTFLMTVCAILGASLFFVGGLKGYVGGALMMLFSWILDHCDGEVRRFRGEDLNLGVYLDRFTHRVSYPLVHLGIGTSLFWLTGGAYWLLTGAVAAYVSNSLDKEYIETKRGGVELYPLRALRLRISSRLPKLDWPLKLAFGGYAQLFQNKILMILIIGAAALDVVPQFYLLYTSLVIFNWLLITLLDFAICFPQPGGQQNREKPKIEGS